MLGSLRCSLVACFAVAACGGSQEGSAAPSTPSTPSASSPAAPADASAESSDATATKAPKEPRGPIDPAKVGTITGVVRFDGPAPERKTLSSGGTGGCPDHAGPVLSEDAIVENGGLANVFVSIQSGLQGWDVPPAKDESFAMDQKGCTYVPHVLGVRVGQTILVHNSDPTTHNVKISSRSNEEMNPIQAPGGQPVAWKPTKKEIAVSFACSLHPWMKSWVCVVDHPWFAVSASDGMFSLQGVPPGEYVLSAWHEKFGKKTANVVVAPGGSADASFTYKPTDKPR